MSTAEPIILKSSAPITTKNGWAKWGYIISLFLVAAGGVGILGLIGVFFVQCMRESFHRDKIRRTKYKFVDYPTTADDIYNKLQPAFKEKYGDKMEFDRDGETLSVHYDKIIYDINVNEDATFCIWWRQSVGRAILPWSDFGLYKKIRTGTPIVAYELQKQFGIN